MYSEYIIVFNSILPFFIIVNLLLQVTFITTTRDFEKENLSAYECGFNPFADARNNFDVKFYLLALSFLVFDIELIYLYSWIITIYHCYLIGHMAMFVFLLILIIGFYYEWVMGIFGSD